MSVDRGGGPWRALRRASVAVEDGRFAEPTSDLLPELDGVENLEIARIAEHPVG